MGQSSLAGGSLTSASSCRYLALSIRLLGVLATILLKLAFDLHPRQMKKTSGKDTTLLINVGVLFVFI